MALTWVTIIILYFIPAWFLSPKIQKWTGMKQRWLAIILLMIGLYFIYFVAIGLVVFVQYFLVGR
jgi:hypothetical protein